METRWTRWASLLPGSLVQPWGGDRGDRLTTHHLQDGADHRMFRGATIFPSIDFISARPFRNIGQRGLLGSFQNPPDERGGGEERGRVGPRWFNLECSLSSLAVASVSTAVRNTCPGWGGQNK